MPKRLWNDYGADFVHRYLRWIFRKTTVFVYFHGSKKKSFKAAAMNLESNLSMWPSFGAKERRRGKRVNNFFSLHCLPFWFSFPLIPPSPQKRLISRLHSSYRRFQSKDKTTNQKSSFELFCSKRRTPRGEYETAGEDDCDQWNKRQ